MSGSLTQSSVTRPGMKHCCWSQKYLTRSPTPKRRGTPASRHHWLDIPLEGELRCSRGSDGRRRESVLDDILLSSSQSSTSSDGTQCSSRPKSSLTRLAMLTLPVSTMRRRFARTSSRCWSFDIWLIRPSNTISRTYPVAAGCLSSTVAAHASQKYFGASASLAGPLKVTNRPMLLRTEALGSHRATCSTLPTCMPRSGAHTERGLLLPPTASATVGPSSKSPARDFIATSWPNEAAAAPRGGVRLVFARP